jgi:hypothetical protein
VRNVVDPARNRAAAARYGDRCGDEPDDDRTECPQRADHGRDARQWRQDGRRPKPPQWYRNLFVNPDITVEYLGESYAARVSTVPNSLDRDRLFQMLSEEITGLYGYQDRCRDTRQIPVIRLRRT